MGQLLTSYHAEYRNYDLDHSRSHPAIPGMLAGGTTRLLLEQIPANVRSICY